MSTSHPGKVPSARGVARADTSPDDATEPEIPQPGNGVTSTKCGGFGSSVVMVDACRSTTCLVVTAAASIAILAATCHQPTPSTPTTSPAPSSVTPSPSPAVSQSTPTPAPLPVRFVVSRNYDETRIFGMFHIDDPAGLESRARSMGIDLDFAKEVRRAESLADIQPALHHLVEERHNALATQLKQAQDAYRAAWESLGPPFSLVVYDITGRRFFYDEYVCVVSAFHKGISDWYGNEVAAGYDLPLTQKKRIVAHEILLSHIFHIVRTSHGKDKLDDWRVWALSEIAAVFILDDERLRGHWSELPRPGQYFSRSNYPQLSRLEQKLYDLYRTRRDFAEFISRAVVLLRRASPP